MCASVCLRVCVCVYVCVCQALWLSPGAARHPQECGSSRLPELPRLHMEVAARKTEGRGRGGGAGKAPSQQSAEPKPSIRQRTVHAIPFPGRQGGRPGQARLPPAAAGAQGVHPGGKRSRGVPACVCGDRGDRSISLGPGGGAAVDSECSSRPGPRDREPRRGHFLPSLGEGCQAFPDLSNTNPIWEEEKLSRERDQHGNRAELTRLVWRGERCLVQRPQCEFPSLSGMLPAGIPPSRSWSCAVRPGPHGLGRLP